MRKLKEKPVKQGIHQLYFQDTKSFVIWYPKKDKVFVTVIRSFKSGDANLLMQELYKRYPGRLLEIEVPKSSDRARAREFWKKEQGFKKVGEKGEFVIMHKLNKVEANMTFKITAEEKQFILSQRKTILDFPKTI
ncbi:MAG: hypothetical protein ABH873_01290, partial [Candidatus Firestonebacteria bacterium]